MAYTEGEQLKLKGMDTVYSHSPEEWKAHVTNVITKIPRGTLVTGEDIRLQCKLQPYHPNAWGATISAHVKRRLLAPTGRYRKSVSPQSHARMVLIYERL